MDELWKADRHWPRYFIADRVWVYADEYRAELAGDEDYSRIVVHAGDDQGWQYRRPLSQRREVAAVLDAIERPVSQQQLAALGFVPWREDYNFSGVDADHAAEPVRHDGEAISSTQRSTCAW